MANKIPLAAISALLLLSLLLAGCVERKLTIITNPADAAVILNDEQIGNSPVTVGFNWYGDYNVTIRKEGFETLKTHRKLDRPLHDKFPFDFFAQLIDPRQIVDSYEWSFELAPASPTDRADLIKAAQTLRTEAVLKAAQK